MNNTSYQSAVSNGSRAVHAGFGLRHIAIAGLALATLVGCDKVKDLREGRRGVEFDGQIFRSRIETVEGDRQQFVITVPNPAKSLIGAREAGRYAATKYCITNYGASDVIWTNGPDVEDGALVLGEGMLTFRGRCKGW